MLYVLEVVAYKRSDLDTLDIFQRKILRQLQSHPDKPTPCNQAVYGLLGAKPIAAIVEHAVLVHFGNILRSDGSIELELARRQLALKEDKSKSWFVHVKQLTYKYELPSVYDLIKSPPGKMEWKAAVTKAVNSYWNEETRREATN
jgi:hypothetical protein